MREPDDLDLARIGELLRRAGWDALVGAGELAARLERPLGASLWSLWLDRSGRFRFTAVRQAGQPESQQIQAGPRHYHVLREQQDVLTVFGSLATSAEWPLLLEDLQRLAQGELVPGPTRADRD